MNIVQTIVPGNSDATSQVNRQSKDNASKRGGSGFSDTLGSLNKPVSNNQGNQSSSNSQASSNNSQPVEKTAPEDDETPASTGAKQPLIATATIPATIFLDPVVKTAPVLEIATDIKLPVPEETPAAQADPDANKTDITQLLGLETETPLPAQSELAKLVTALSKLAVSSKGDGDEHPNADPAKEDAAPGDAAAQSNDLLALLASTAMPVDQTAPKVTGSVLGAVASATADTNPLPTAEAPPPTVVRLQKQDVPAIDLHIATNEDGSTKLDVAMAAGDASDVVQVVESRRFVGLAQPSHATTITSALAADPEWAAKMAGQTTSNSPMISSTGQVVHVLKIQMTPVELGHVTAAMKLVGDELSVQLTAHTLKGYSELQKDSSGILDALKAQGFTVDQVTVTLASNNDRQDNSPANRQQMDMGQPGTQQGQRGHDEKSQEQFYRQPQSNVRDGAESHESTSQPEAPARISAARPSHVYL